MFMKKKSVHAFLLLAPVAALMMTACSSEPSSSDMKIALEGDLKQALQMQSSVANVFGGRGTTAPATGPKLEDIRKVGCKGDGEKAYLCDVEIVIVNGAEKKTKVVPARFVKTSSGWQAVK